MIALPRFLGSSIEVARREGHAEEIDDRRHAPGLPSIHVVISKANRASSMGRTQQGSIINVKRNYSRARSSIGGNAIRVRGAINRSTQRAFRKEMLTTWTMLGIVVGVVLGVGVYFAKPSEAVIKVIGYPGQLMLSALQLLVLPAIVLALMCAVLGLRHTRTGAGTLVKRVLLFYLLTMSAATALGILFCITIKPGSISGSTLQTMSIGGDAHGADLSGAAKNADGDILTSFLNIGYIIIPKNIVLAASSSNYLGCMAFASAFAVVLVTIGEDASAIISLIEVTNEVVTNMMLYVIYCAPVAVPSIIASAICSADDIGVVFKALAAYLGIVLGVQLLHNVITLPLLCLTLGHRNPFTVLKVAYPAIALAFGTASSAASMPQQAQAAAKLGVRGSLSRFMISVMINLCSDGHSVFLAVSAIFLAQGNGMSLTISNIIVIFVMSILSAMSMPAIPYVSIIALSTLMNMVGMAAYIPQISLLFVVDWIIDMHGTAGNVWSNCIAMAVVEAMTQRAECRKEAKEREAADGVALFTSEPSMDMRSLAAQLAEMEAGSGRRRWPTDNTSPQEISNSPFAFEPSPTSPLSPITVDSTSLSPRGSHFSSSLSPANLCQASAQGSFGVGEHPELHPVPRLLSLAFPAICKLGDIPIRSLRRSLHNELTSHRSSTHMESTQQEKQARRPLLSHKPVAARGAATSRASGSNSRVVALSLPTRFSESPAVDSRDSLSVHGAMFIPAAVAKLRASGISRSSFINAPRPSLLSFADPMASTLPNRKSCPIVVDPRKRN